MTDIEAQKPKAQKRKCTGEHGQRSGQSPAALPVIQSHPLHAAGPPIRRSRSARWRAGVLIAVHVAIAAHITHWFVSGRTLSPVEPSESMFTLEKGELNAGFIFFSLAILSTIVFGRFFCGWGCHIVALQDLCGWMMKKVGVRPRPFRSRLLVWVPLALALYMFVWPTFKRLLLLPLLESAWPQAAGWLAPVPPWNGFSNHLITEDFFVTFPGLAIAIPFFLVIGFAAVYFLGSKGFCTYGCPYGGFFGLVTPLAPGQILADLNACEGCGHCTASCTSNVRVHEEIQVYSKVVSPGCMKCLDCVSVCPNDALSFGFAKPHLFTRKQPLRAAAPPKFDLTHREELVMGALFLGGFLAFRGVYRVIPMLMAAGLAGLLVFAGWKLWRLVKEPNLRFHRFQLKKDGEIRRAGGVLAAGSIAFLLLAAHSGMVQLAEARARTLDDRVALPREFVLQGHEPARLPQELLADAGRALQLYQVAAPIGAGGIGLLPTPGLRLRMAWLHLVRGERGRAQALLEEEIGASGASDALAADLGRVMALRGETEAAQAWFRETLAAHPEFHSVRRAAAALSVQLGRGAEALQLLRAAVEAYPELPAVRVDLAGVLLAAGDREGALEQLRRAREFAPHDPTIQQLLAGVEAGD